MELTHADTFFSSPKNTINIGRVEGGTSVNSVPISVSMEVDMRSESAAEPPDSLPIVQKTLAAAKAVGITKARNGRR